MKADGSAWLRWLLVTAVIVLASRPLSARVLDRATNIAGTTMHYKVILPNSYDPAKTYPAVLAFPGGPQTMQTVEGTLERNWREQAERLGYIVIVPAAPDGQLFFREGAKVFPAFLVQLLSDFKIFYKKFHITR